MFNEFHQQRGALPRRIKAIQGSTMVSLIFLVRPRIFRLCAVRGWFWQEVALNSGCHARSPWEANPLPGRWSVSAYWMGIQVGQVLAVHKEAGSVLLGDIVVKNQVEVRRGFLARTIRRFYPGWGLAFPRRIGIGTELLKRFIQACERDGVREIYGNVTPDADRDHPFLRGWYEGFGFVVSPPDGRDEWFPIKYKVIRMTRQETA
jgi:GNAT superfamily N-acetyltransferase